MHVTVLCGGKGTRLGADGPKCLVDINGVPFIEHKIDRLRRDGATSFTLLVGPYVNEFAYLRHPMVADEQEGVARALQYVREDAWWTMGDVLVRHRLDARTDPMMLVKYAPEKANIAGLYLDCGLYYGKSGFRLVQTVPQDLVLTINTPADLEATREALR